MSLNFKVKFKYLGGYIFFTIFLINCFIIAVPNPNEDFEVSDHFFILWLRSLGFKPKQPETYQQVPLLASGEFTSLPINHSYLLNRKFSEYFVPGWADTRWQYRKNITIDHLKVSSNLVNFPVLIDIYDSDLQNDAQASGNDIIFSDIDGSILESEIDFFDRSYNSTHAHLVAWVKTNLSSTQDTLISMYYGNPTADPQASVSGVWDENYIGVWHLNEEGNGNVDEYKDSSQYNNDGQGGEGNTSFVPTRVDGKLGYAQDFNNLDGYYDLIDCGNDSSFNITGYGITLEAWIHHNITPTSHFYGILNHKGWYNGYSLWIDQLSLKLTFNLPGEDYQVKSTSDVTTNTWHHVVATYDGVYIRVYIDGILEGTLPKTDAIEPSDSEQDFWIGHGDQPKDKLWSAEWEGQIDEVRISNIGRSSEWIETEYNNQYDPKNFLSVSSKESYGSDDWPFKLFQYRKNITIDSGMVNAELTDFPVLIKLYDTDLHDIDKVQTDGEDIIFCDESGTKLDHEIELFDQAGNGTHANLVAWVRVPVLSNTSDTILTMYYGNPAVPSQQNAQGVWNNSYTGIWHLNGISGSQYDSVLDLNNGLIHGTINQDYNGIFDGADEFLGITTESWIEINNSPQLIENSAFTVEAWIYLQTLPNAYVGLVQKGREAEQNWYGLWVDNLNQISFGWDWQGTPSKGGNVPGSTLSTGQWYYAVGTFDGTNRRLYLDGTLDAGPDSGWYENDSENWHIGTDGNLNYFDGIIDEVRISKTARTDEWINTTYNNLYNPSQFYSITDEETYPNWWADTSFNKRRDIIIDHTKVENTTLYDFPVLLKFEDSSLKSGSLQPDASDILFTDADGTKLAHEVESFTQNDTYGLLITWVKLPELSAIDDTIFSFYYGNPDVEDQENPASVWDNNFKGVWHLSIIPTGTIGEVVDSTLNNNDGYTIGTMSETDLVDSQIGYGFDLDGIDDMIVMNESTSLDSINDAGTISMWINVVNSSDGDYQRIMVSSNTFPDRTSGLEIGLQPDGDIFFYPNEENSFNYNLITDPLVDITWHYITFTMDFGTKNAEIFVDGTFFPFTIENVPSNWSQLAIIDDWFWGGDDYHYKFLTGILDEIRVSDTVRSAEWIATEYINQYNPLTFSSFGPEYLLDLSPPTINNFGVEDAGTGTGKFWADISDAVSGVSSVTIKINGTEDLMSFNGTDWIFQKTVVFGGFYEFQIINASDTRENYISSPSIIKNYTFNLDNIAPDVIDWEYYDYIGTYGTFKANVSDSWGTIDRIIVNVTEGTVPSGERWATMVSIASGFMNDTIILSPGAIKFVVIVNDTAGNTFSSTEHQGLVPGINQAPIVENVTLSRSAGSVLLPIYSNNILYLDYDYTDPESDPDQSEIRWYKNGVYQPTYDDQKQIPASALVKNDDWNATIHPYDGQDFGDLVASPLVEIQNTPPNATSVVVLPGSPVTTSTLSVSYSYSDYDGDSQNTANREIRWYKEGVLQSALNDLLSVASGFTSKGEEWYYEIRVHDGTNYSSWVTSTSVIIANSAPSATAVQVLPSTPVTGNTLTANYTFSDADGDGESGSLIRWYKNGVLQKTLNDSISIDPSYTLKGESWYFTIQPGDGTTYGTLKQAPTVVIGNTAPTAASLQINPGTPKTGDILTAYYNYTDADNDTESGTLIIWYKDGLLQGALNNSPSVASSYTAKGQKWHFKVRPSDGISEGLWYNCPVNVTIMNTEPSVNNLVLNPSIADTTDDLVVIYDYFDADSDSESNVEILWYMNGSLQGNYNDSIILQAGNTTRGQIWHVKVRVFDGVAYSLWSALAINVTINNAAPSVSDVTINGNNAPTQVGDNEDLIGSYVFSDPDGDSQVNASREIFWYKKNQSESSFILQGYLNNSLIVGNESTSFGDTWYFIIRVYDGFDYSIFVSSPSVSIGVPPNTPPEAQLLNITPAIPVTSDSLYINYTFVDADNDNDSGSLFYWYRNGILMPQYNGLRTLPAFATSKGEIWHVKVRPRDGIDFGQLVSVPVNVTIGNSAPEASSLEISPVFPVTGNNLGVSYLFFDTDGDSEVGSDIIWYVNGVLQHSLNGSFTVTASFTIKGQEWHFKLRPKDGTDFGTWISCSVNVTIGNTAPSASSLTITPVDPLTGEDLIANYLFSDPDASAGDTEGISLIRWFKNGEEQLSYENQTSIPSLATKKGENWWFEVTPFDGTDYGSKKISALITIKNTAPSASNLQFNPSLPMTGIDLSISYTYNDVDSDLEVGTIILWYKNGFLESSYTNIKTIDGAVLIKDDRWNVSVKVSDGLSFDIWLNGSILIANTPPMIIIDTAEIFEPPTGLVTTSSLIAIWNTYDADGDPIIDYKITWENRTSGSGLFIEQYSLENFTEVPAIYTKKNQDWRFKIQVFDGEAWSTLSVSFLSTIENSEPIVENILLSGGLTTIDPIMVTYDFYDPDGDPDQSEILWGIYHISPPFIFILGTQTLPASTFTAGDLIWVEITPDDNDASTGQGDPLDTSRMSGAGKQIQVGDTAPQVNTTLSLPTILADHPDGTTLFTAGYSLYVNYSTLVFDIDSGESSSIFDISKNKNDDIFYSNVNYVLGTQYRWYKFNSGTGRFELQPSLTGQLVDSYYLHRDEQWLVSVRPRDNYGYYGSWVNSTSILIGNSYPQVMDFQWSTAYPTTSDDLSFSFTYFDYDGDPFVESQTLIIWYKNGIIIPGTINQTVLLSTNFIKDDNITVVFRPFDGTDWAGKNYSSLEFVGTLVILNSPPKAINVTLSPLSPSTLDPLVLTWTFTDADNDSESAEYRIEWRRSGVIVPELENQTIIPFYYTSKGETWQAQIWLFDGEDYSIFGYISNEGNVVFIQNSPTEITGVQFAGVESQTIANVNLLVEWNTSDVDNDGQIDYEIYWYCDNGSGSYEYRSNFGVHTSLISPIDLIKGQSWYCIIKIYDGTDWSSNATSPIISIINAAPEVTDLAFVFDPLTSRVDPDIRIDEFYVQDEDIIILPNYYDIDNDVSQIKIEWFKIINGSILEMTTFENASFIPAEALFPGEQWFCRITPYDGFTTGNPINSSIIPIYSRPVCYSYDITPGTQSEGIYQITVSVTDSLFEVTEVQVKTIFYDNSSKTWPTLKSLGDNWTLEFELEDLSYLDTNMTIEIKCITSVTTFEIYAVYSLELLLEDKAPPRVIDAFFEKDNEKNPTNLTFEAHVEEFGLAIAQVELFYYFSQVNDESGGDGSNFKMILNNHILMDFVEYNPIGNYYVYKITVEFVHNNTDTDIIYWISTMDSVGNIKSLAFDIRNYPQRIKEQRFIYNPPGLPEWVLLVAGIVVVLIFIGAVVYVKFIRKPELVGLDKELVLSKVSEISEAEVQEVLDEHTIGIVISFFDQRHGPIPIVVVPDILKDNFNKLVELSDRSFSGTGFSDTFDKEIPSSYDFVIDYGVRSSILSFGFALNRPTARGGQENLTLNIIVHQDLFPLIQSFQKSIQAIAHEIHMIMNDEGTEKDVIKQQVIQLRKYVSSIVLSYVKIYGTTDLLEED